MSGNSISKFESYDKTLSVSCSDDCWLEFWEDHAISTINEFNVQDWSNLSDTWEKRPLIWQKRCADILSEVRSKENLPILYSMLQSKHEELIEASVDSMRSLISYGVKININPNQMSIIKDLAHKGGITEMIVSDFLKILSK